MDSRPSFSSQGTGTAAKAGHAEGSEGALAPACLVAPPRPAAADAQSLCQVNVMRFPAFAPRLESWYMPVRTAKIVLALLNTSVLAWLRERRRIPDR
jgi:hypothetical protein